VGFALALSSISLSLGLLNNLKNVLLSIRVVERGVETMFVLEFATLINDLFGRTNGLNGLRKFPNGAFV
jgi:hypothetical protein